MIPSLEYFFVKILKDAFKFYQENPQFIDYLVSHPDPSYKNTLRIIASQSKVNFYITDAISNFRIPAVIISCEEERESIREVGQQSGDLQAVSLVEVTGEALSLDTYGRGQLGNFPIYQITVYCNGEKLLENQYLLDYYTGKIQILGEYYIEEGVYTADYTYFQNYAEPQTTVIEANYSISVISNNLNEVMILYRIAQHSLLSLRTLVSGLGVKNQQLFGSGIMPYMREDQPEPLFQRQLTLNFEIEVSGYNFYDILRKIELTV
jgi:hypothetical protein